MKKLIPFALLIVVSLACSTGTSSEPPTAITAVTQIVITEIAVTQLPEVTCEPPVPEAPLPTEQASSPTADASEPPARRQRQANSNGATADASRR